MLITELKADAEAREHRIISELSKGVGGVGLVREDMEFDSRRVEQLDRMIQSDRSNVRHLEEWLGILHRRIWALEKRERDRKLPPEEKSGKTE